MNNILSIGNRFSEMLQSSTLFLPCALPIITIIFIIKTFASGEMIVKYFRRIGLQIFLIVLLVMGCSNVSEPAMMAEVIERNEPPANVEKTDDVEEERALDPSTIQDKTILSVEIEYVSNPQRLFAKLYAYDESIAFYQLPYDDNELAVRFNQVMDRPTVERAIRESLADDVTYQFEWQDDYTIHVQLSGKPSDKIHVIRFDGVHSQIGEELKESIIFSFKFIEPKSFYSYSLQDGNETLIYSPKMAIDDARLLSDSNHVLITDQIGDFFGPYYDTYVLNLTEGTLIHYSSDEYYEKLAQVEYYEDHTVYVVYDVGLDTIQEALDHENVSITYQGAVFSPDRRKVAFFMIDQAYYELEHGQLYPIHITVFDLEKRDVIEQYRNVFYDIFEYDGTDAIPPERYLHYKLKNARWIEGDKIIIEYLNEDETEMLMGSLNLTTGDFQTIASGVVDPVFSPVLPYFIARVWNEPIAHLYDVNGEILETFSVSMIHSPIWSKAGDRFVYIDPDSKAWIYDVKSYSSLFIGSNLNIAGWLDEEHLLIYK